MQPVPPNPPMPSVPYNSLKAIVAKAQGVAILKMRMCSKLLRSIVDKHMEKHRLDMSNVSLEICDTGPARFVVKVKAQNSSFQYAVTTRSHGKGLGLDALSGIFLWAKYDKIEMCPHDPFGLPFWLFDSWLMGKRTNCKELIWNSSRSLDKTEIGLRVKTFGRHFLPDNYVFTDVKLNPLTLTHRMMKICLVYHDVNLFYRSAYFACRHNDYHVKVEFDATLEDVLHTFARTRQIGRSSNYFNFTFTCTMADCSKMTFNKAFFYFVNRNSLMPIVLDDPRLGDDHQIIIFNEECDQHLVAYVAGFVKEENKPANLLLMSFRPGTPESFLETLKEFIQKIGLPVDFSVPDTITQAVRAHFECVASGIVYRLQ